MEIANIWANREAPTGRWYRSIYCSKWHQQLRLWLAKQILKSLFQNDSWARIDTGSSAINLGFGEE